MSIGRILITGKNGQLGWELRRTFESLGEVTVLDRGGMDLARPDSIRAVIRDVKPNLIVNAAAYTAVDKAESEPELAMAVNGVAPGILAEEAKNLGALLIHYSTNYVFDGTKQGPYTEADEAKPLNVYGKTKLAGEQAVQSVRCPHLIFRTGWVYGARGRNFLLKILNLAKGHDDLRVVNDQYGTPTWTRTIAEATSQIVVSLDFSSGEARSQDASGIYHLTSSGQTSWFGFAKAIMEYRASQTTDCLASKVMPIPTTEYSTLAKRPANSILSNSKLAERFGLVQPDWQRCLALCLEELCR